MVAPSGSPDMTATEIRISTFKSAMKDIIKITRCAIFVFQISGFGLQILIILKSEF